MKKTIKFLVTIALISMLAIGCTNDSNGTKDDDTYKVGFSVSTLNNPFFIDLLEGAETAAEERGWELISTDAQDDTSTQISGVEDMLQQDIDVLLINATDSDGVVSAVEAANEAGVPVITVDRVSNGGDVVTHVASDNVLGGEMAAEHIVELLDGKGKVVELEGIAGVMGTRLRGEGFNNVVGDIDEIEVVARQNADYDRTMGLTVMENILQANEEIDAVFAHNDEMALGAYEAIVAADREMIIVGFDAIDDAVESIENGQMTATVAQQPKLISQVAIEAAEKVLNGENVEETIPVELKLVTKN